jgi:hypothetical protein
LRRRKAGETEDLPIQIDPKLVTEAENFARAALNIEKGQYELIVAAIDRNEKPIAATKLAFTLYESNLQTLDSVIDGYKYGYGIVGGGTSRRIHIEPRLRRVGTDPRTVIEEYQRFSDKFTR